MTTGNYRDLTLTKVLIVMIILAALMAVFLSYYFKQEQEIKTTALQAVAASFMSQVMVVRSQWLMEKKPQQVIIELKENNKAIKKMITVNKQGWIDTLTKNNACEKIWLMVMDRPLAFFNMPIGAVNIKNSQNTETQQCRYSVQNGDYFEYNSANGQVSKVYNKNYL